MAAPPARARADYDYLIKLLLIGDSGVGKSCLLLRFSDGSFTTSFITTIGIDFKIRTIELDGKRIKLQIWDTAGQERFRTITTAYYRGAMGILLVYDVTDESSFNNIRNWIRNIEQHASDNVNKILIGNKADMDESKRAVPTSKGQALADEYGIKFFETSAKTNLNVEQVFFSIARDIKQRLAETDSKPEVIVLSVLIDLRLVVRLRHHRSQLAVDPEGGYVHSTTQRRNNRQAGMAEGNKLQYVTVLQGLSLVALLLLSGAVRDAAAADDVIGYHAMASDQENGKNKELYRPGDAANKYHQGCEEEQDCRGGRR
ncbi:hypothetical protein U9M48_012262 [Paspalum notatum var. saurae]|uniref:Uncharacterized protein n=1 Tax=Paspalum notatum var. saurae TaxID=547442 RepID=A0AAQ3SX45_PASNO